MREVEFERVDGGVDAELGDRAAEHGGRIQVRERGRRCRVGQVVGRHVDGLDRRDRALVGRGDPLLQTAHVGAQRRLVAHGRGDAAEQRRHLGARLGEAEDVVDEEQHVLVLLVAEILGEGQAGEADTGTGTGRLVHLAVDQRHLGLRAVLLVDDAGLHHLVIEVVALARALADAGEHRDAAMRLGDVVDQLHDQHGLADAGATEEADLAALRVGRQQIDDLDAGDQDLGIGRLVDEGGCRSVDRRGDLDVDRPGLVDRLADDVEDPPERLAADRHRDGSTRVDHLLAAGQAVGAVHGDGAHGRFAQVLGHLEHQRLALVGRMERVQDVRQVAVELDVDDGAGDVRDAPLGDVILGYYGLVHAPAPSIGVRVGSGRARALDRFGARDDLDEFLGDLRLALPVVAAASAC